VDIVKENEIIDVNQSQISHAINCNNKDNSIQSDDSVESGT